jgi:hypothetical protein
VIDVTASPTIFYRSGNRMMAVELSATPNVVLLPPHVLFEQRYDTARALPSPTTT